MGVFQYSIRDATSRRNDRPTLRGKSFQYSIRDAEVALTVSEAIALALLSILY